MYKDVHCLPCLRYFFAVFLVSTPSISKGSRKRGIREHFANKPIKSKKSLPKRTAASTDTPPAPPKTRPAGTTWSIPWAAKLSLLARLRWYGGGFITRSSDYWTAFGSARETARAIRRKLPRIDGCLLFSLSPDDRSVYYFPKTVCRGHCNIGQ